MKQFRGRLGLVICLLTALVLQAESPASLYKKGKDAEAAQMYEAAYELYKQAYDKDPKDLRFRVAFEPTRFYAAAAKVHRAHLSPDRERLQTPLPHFKPPPPIIPS